MKTIMWIIKCFWTIILLIITSKGKLFGVDLLWSDLLLAIQIDAIITIILYLLTTRKEKQSKSKNIILYILFYGNAIKGFGRSLTDLAHRIHSLTKLRQSVSEESKLSLKALKITITDKSIESEDIIIY